MKLFDASETTSDLDKLLQEDGFDPADKTVDAVKQIISRYYAKRTADVLEHVNQVLAKFAAANDR